MTGFRVIYWGHCFCRTDFGGWVNAKVRPRWYWWLCRVRLFIRIWRVTASFPPTPAGDEWSLDAETAWTVAGIVYDGKFAGPMRTYAPPIDEARLAELDKRQPDRPTGGRPAASTLSHKENPCQDHSTPKTHTAPKSSTSRPG